MTSWTTHELDQIGSSPKPQINRKTDGRQNLPVRPYRATGSRFDANAAYRVTATQDTEE
jgi:hypothetical protein